MRLGEFEKRERLRKGETQREVAVKLEYRESCGTDISRLETNRLIRPMKGVRLRYIYYYLGTGRKHVRAKALLLLCDDLRPMERNLLQFIANM